MFCLPEKEKVGFVFAAYFAKRVLQGCGEIVDQVTSGESKLINGVVSVKQLMEKEKEENELDLSIFFLE